MASESRDVVLRRLFIIIALIVAIASVAYAAFAEQIIRNVYDGKSFALLNSLITDQQHHPVDYYLKLVDETFWKRIIGFPLTVLFAILIYRILKYFFLKMEPSDNTTEVSLENLLKHDLLIAAGLYVLLTVLYFYPCLPSLGTHLLGPPEDNMAAYWSQWWAYDKVLHGSASLTLSNYVYYPEGSLLYYNTWSFYNLLLSFVLRFFGNGVAAYNLIMLHTFPLAGVGGFLLVRYITRNSYLALIGGFIFAFSPNHFIRAQHHIHINSIQFIPFFVLYFIRTVRERSRKCLLLAALFFLLNSLCDWNYMIFAGYFMLFSYIYLAIRRRQIILGDLLLKMTVIVGVTLLVLSPWLWQMIKLGMQHEEVVLPGHNSFVADLFGLIIPDYYHWLNRISLIDKANNLYTGNSWETTVYLGIVSLTMVALAFSRIVRRSAKYFIGAIAFLIMALGTNPHLLGQTIPIRLPDQVISQLPFLSNVRCPARFIVYVYLFWSVIVVLALQNLLASAKSSRVRVALSVLLPLLLFVDYYSVCKEKTEVSVPYCYQVIARDKETFGILDLPAGYQESCRYMMYQTIHGIPIVEGAITRKIGQSLIDCLELDDLEKQKQQLAESKVKYIVIHRELLPEKWVSPDKYRLLYPVVFEDRQSVVFRVY